MTPFRLAAAVRGDQPSAGGDAFVAHRGGSRGAAPAPRDLFPTVDRPALRLQAWLVVRRDLSLGVAGRRAAMTVGPVSTAVLLLAGLAFGTDPAVVAATAPALIWLVVLLATVPLARVVAADETVDDCWSLLRGTVHPAALLAGKLVAQWALLAAVWVVTTLLATVLLGVVLPPVAVVAGLLGTLGLAAAMTLLGLLLLDDRGRGAGPLSVLVLPLGMPVLLAGARLATPAVAIVPWLVLLVVYDMLLLAVAWATFPVMVEG